MQIEISFIHMEHTPALDKLIREKSGKFSKWMQKVSKIKWTCYIKDKRHYAEVGIVGAGDELFAKASSGTLYRSIDLAVAKLERQLGKRKEKMKNKIHRHTKITATTQKKVSKRASKIG